MELGTLEIQIFVSLVVVLGTAFVALVCDFLKGYNEQLRERNIELRVREDERDRLGLFNPAVWFQGMAAIARQPELAQSFAGVPAPAPQPAAQPAPEAAPARRVAVEEQVEQRPASGSRRQYVEDRVRPRATTWASKEELEQLADRAARIRARHESAQEPAQEVAQETKATQPEAVAAEVAEAPVAQPEPVAEQPVEPISAPIPDFAVRAAEAPVAEQPAEPEAAEEPVAEEAVEPTAEVAVEPVPEAVPEPVAEPIAEVAAEPLAEAAPAADEEIAVVQPIAEAIAEEAPVEPFSAEPIAVEPVAVEPTQQPVSSFADVLRSKIFRIDHNAPERFEREELDIDEEIERVASLNATEEAEPTAEVEIPEQIEAAAEIAQPITEPFAEQPIEPAVEEPVAAVEEAVAEEEIHMEAEPEAELASTPEVNAVPAGFHDASVLSTLLEQNSVFHGVVAVVGINDYESLRDRMKSSGSSDSMRSLERMVQALLGSQDFASRFQEDEFILLFPGESGPSAQRRLFQVSEKLWDFQLRSLGSLSVMFSWGGLEAQGEPIAEAIASARERMYQTKRNRKPAPSPISIGRRVVNG